jgi:polar amino acid transport system substrate-binding protein
LPVPQKGRHDVVVHSLDDARHYRIGVVNMDFREEYLRRKGFGEAGSQPLMVVNSSDLLLPMLQAGRIDLMPLGLAKCAPHGLDCNAIEPVYVLSELESALYMVFSRDTSDALVQQVREGFEQARRNGQRGAHHGTTEPHLWPWRITPRFLTVRC